MRDDLYRLVYYSRNRITCTDEEALEELRGILAASRVNNAKAGVTGALIFNSGCFGQVLEGPRRAVEATFERIQRDPRHGEVSLLAFEEITERAFPNWSMALVSAAEPQAGYAAISAESGFDPSRMTAQSLFTVLHDLTLEQERHA